MINLEQVLMSIITYAVPTASMVMIGWLIRAIKAIASGRTRWKPASNAYCGNRLSMPIDIM